MCRFVIAALLLLCASPSFASRITCTNTTNQGTFTGTSTGEPGTLPILTFVVAGYGGDDNQCQTTPSHCILLPCAMAGCTDLPYNTQNCLGWLESSCGTESPTIRQVTYLYDGPCSAPR